MPKRKTVQPASNLDEFIFDALKKVTFKTDQQSLYYHDCNEHNILKHKIVIPPIGSSDAERLDNAQRVIDRFVDKDGPFKLQRLNQYAAIQVKKNERITVSFKKKEKRQTCYALEPNAPIGTLVIHGGVIKTIFERYAQLNQAGANTSEPVSVPNNTVTQAPLESITESGLTFQFAEAPHLVNLNAVNREQSDDELSSLRQVLNEVNQAVDEAEKRTAKLKAKSKECDDIKTDIEAKRLRLDESQKEEKKLQTEIKTKVSDIKTVLAKSPIHGAGVQNVPTPRAGDQAEITPSSMLPN